MLLHLMGQEFDEETTKLNYSYYENGHYMGLR